jgi:hypothetical protein
MKGNVPSHLRDVVYGVTTNPSVGVWMPHRPQPYPFMMLPSHSPSRVLRWSWSAEHPRLISCFVEGAGCKNGGREECRMKNLINSWSRKHGFPQATNFFELFPLNCLYFNESK